MKRLTKEDRKFLMQIHLAQSELYAQELVSYTISTFTLVTILFGIGVFVEKIGVAALILFFSVAIIGIIAIYRTFGGLIDMPKARKLKEEAYSKFLVHYNSVYPERRKPYKEG